MLEIVYDLSFTVTSPAFGDKEVRDAVQVIAGRVRVRRDSRLRFDAL